MLGLVLFASAVVVASASKCCIPPQWEGQLTSLVAIGDGKGRGEFAQVSDFLAYDAVSHKFGVMEYVTVRGNTSQFAILMDYNTDSRYVIHDGKCLRTRLGMTVTDFTGCVPDNATEIGSEDVIGYGNNDAKLNTYALNYPGIVVHVSVTADACVPVVRNSRGNINGNTFLQNDYFFNITAGLSDMTVANLASPPAGCENAPTVEASFTQTFIGKRSLFGGFMDF